MCKIGGVPAYVTPTVELNWRKYIGAIAIDLRSDIWINYPPKPPNLRHVKTSLYFNLFVSFSIFIASVGSLMDTVKRHIMDWMKNYLQLPQRRLSTTNLPQDKWM